MPTDDLSAFEQNPFDGNERRGEVVDMLEGKKGKEDAGYLNEETRKELGMDDEIQAACRDCGSYVSPEEPKSKCELVMGTVEAGGVCDMFNPAISGQGIAPAAGEIFNADSLPPQL